MKPFKCRQCRAEIAFINGPHKFLDCPHCGKRNKVYTNSTGIRLVIKTALILICSLNVFGQDRVLVNLVNFQDDQRRPYTVEQMEQAMVTVDAFYRENSNGLKSFAVEVRDWRTIPITKTCEQAAIGGTVEGYDKVIWAYPFIGCSYAGSGYANGVAYTSTDNLSTVLLAHELGHTYQFEHSAATDCAPLIFCTTAILPYGDVWDVMGGGQLNHFNAFHKESVGWMTVPEVTTGTYTLNSHQAIKIKRADGSFYYVEFRRPVGFDWSLERFNVSVGVAVRIVYSRSYLLDMTPETSSRYDSLLTGTYSEGGITISLISVGESAVVSVTTPTIKPTCLRYNAKGKCIKN